jgi:hypothetical protein
MKARGFCPSFLFSLQYWMHLGKGGGSGDFRREQETVQGLFLREFQYVLIKPCRHDFYCTSLIFMDIVKITRITTKKAMTITGPRDSRAITRINQNILAS